MLFRCFFVTLPWYASLETAGVLKKWNSVEFLCRYLK